MRATGWTGYWIDAASTLRMAEIRKAYGPDAPLVWMVYEPCYRTRGQEDGKPYTQWISGLAAERRATLEQQREDIKVTLSELEASEAAAKKRLKELRGGR